MFRNNLLTVAKYGLTTAPKNRNFYHTIKICGNNSVFGAMSRPIISFGLRPYATFSTSSKSPDNSSSFVQNWRNKFSESNSESNSDSKSDSKSNSDTINQSISPEPLTTSEVVSNNVGLSRFLYKVYLTSGIGITGSLGTAWALSIINPVFVASYTPHLLLGGTLIGITGCVGLSVFKYTLNINKTESINSNGRLASFGLITGGMALSMTPLFTICQIVSPMILPVATVMSLITMGGATAYAYSMPSDKLLSWEGPLYVGLLGVCGVGLTAFGSLMIFGPNTFASLLHSVDVYGGIVVFTGLSAYETHLAINMYRNGNPDHLGCATNVFLDFINLFVRFAEILIRSKK